MNTSKMLPITFDLAKYPTSDTIRLLASLLERMTMANDLLNKTSNSRRGSLQQQQSTTTVPSPTYTRFHARLVPSIDIYSYLSRILKYCPCANECFLSLLVYFDRMSKNSIALTGKPFTIDSFNIHRLIIAGVMVASKFFSDVFYTNTRYAKVGGLPVSELNCLEIEFLKLNSFNLTVPISELQKYGDHLLKVGYLQQQQEQQQHEIKYRHTRSSSLDQTRLDFDRMNELTNRMSLDEHSYYNNNQQQQQQGQRRYNNNGYKKNSSSNVRRMTSTNSLKDYHQQYPTTNSYEPRHSRSSVNLHQGYYGNSPLQQTSDSTNRRLSITSIYAAPFIPNSDQIHQVNSYYYPIVGIPTPPPSSSSPIPYQPPSSSSLI